MLPDGYRFEYPRRLPAQSDESLPLRMALLSDYIVASVGYCSCRGVLHGGQVCLPPEYRTSFSCRAGRYVALVKSKRPRSCQARYCRDRGTLSGPDFDGTLQADQGLEQFGVTLELCD